MSPLTRRKKRKLCSTAIPGQSSIERLPIEQIHFICPGHLPQCSKALLACFSPPNLPLHQTIDHVLSLPSFRTLNPDTNDERTAWFLSRAYLRAEKFVTAFVKGAYLMPDSYARQELAAAPLFDPWLFFMANPDVCLPSSLTHFIYHTYPTNSYRLADVAIRDLAEGRIERAEQLFAVGAIPGLASQDAIRRATEPSFRLPGFSSIYASERLLKWKPSQALLRKVCTCGFDASAAAQEGRGNNEPTGPTQQAILSKIADPSINLTAKWTELKKNSPEEYPEYIVEKLSYGACRQMQHWMLPFNGTVGRYPFPFSNVKSTLDAYAQCQHQGGITRDFLIEYVQDIHRRFAPEQEAQSPQ